MVPGARWHRGIDGRERRQEEIECPAATPRFHRAAQVPPTCKSGSTTEIFVCPRRLLRQGTSGSGAESDRAARDFPWMIRGASCRAPVGSPELCGEGNLSVSGVPTACAMRSSPSSPRSPSCTASRRSRRAPGGSVFRRRVTRSASPQRSSFARGLAMPKVYPRFLTSTRLLS